MEYDTVTEERDLSHWAEWSDGELIDQAAAACQSRILLEDKIVRQAIAQNIIKPFRQAMTKLNEFHKTLGQQG